MMQEVSFCSSLGCTGDFQLWNLFNDNKRDYLLVVSALCWDIKYIISFKPHNNAVIKWYYSHCTDGNTGSFMGCWIS